MVISNGQLGFDVVGFYISLKDVEKRLIGKVFFTEDECEQNKLFIGLAEEYIREAEMFVENDLSVRYFVPFMYNFAGVTKTFSALPQRPTQETVRTLCKLKAISHLISMSFGKGGHISGENYKKSCDEAYKNLLEVLLRVSKTGKYESRPLPMLMLQYNNTNDDGFIGKVSSTSSMQSNNYGRRQITDPSIPLPYAQFPGVFYDNVN